MCDGGAGDDVGVVGCDTVVIGETEIAFTRGTVVTCLHTQRIWHDRYDMLEPPVCMLCV